MTTLVVVFGDGSRIKYGIMKVLDFNSSFNLLPNGKKNKIKVHRDN